MYTFPLRSKWYSLERASKGKTKWKLNERPQINKMNSILSEIINVFRVSDTSFDSRSFDDFSSFFFRFRFLASSRVHTNDNNKMNKMHRASSRAKKETKNSRHIYEWNCTLLQSDEIVKYCAVRRIFIDARLCTHTHTQTERKQTTEFVIISNSFLCRSVCRLHLFVICCCFQR